MADKKGAGGRAAKAIAGRKAGQAAHQAGAKGRQDQPQAGKPKVSPEALKKAKTALTDTSRQQREIEGR